MTRGEAEELLNRYVSSEWLKNHSLATAAVMEALAARLGEDPEEWWVAGLLHDLDFDLTPEPHEHGRKGAEILESHGLQEEVVQAVLAHNAEGLGLERRSRLDYALTCGESVTGLVVATALVMPDRKLASVSPSSVVKRMKKKEFARKVSRENILLCERIGIPLEEFAAITVEAMQKVADRLQL